MKRYPWFLLPRLASAIEFSQKESAHRDLELVMDIIWEQSQGTLSLCKLRCAAVSSFCSRGALQAGAPSQPVLKVQLSMLNLMTTARSGGRVRAMMHGFIDDLLARVKPVETNTIEHTVARVRKIMRQSLANGPSLSEHAAASRLSVSHLSRCFAEITGRTFQQETRRLRFDRAKELLTQTDLKIAAVAEEIGFNDASRFIAEFRREFGLTPGQYRNRRGRSPMIGQGKRSAGSEGDEDNMV